MSTSVKIRKNTSFCRYYTVGKLKMYEKVNDI